MRIKHCLVLRMVLANKKVETLLEHHKFLLLVHVRELQMRQDCDHNTCHNGAWVIAHYISFDPS